MEEIWKNIEKLKGCYQVSNKGNGAIKEKMNYIGSELSKAQCEYAERRIKQETRQLTLF